MVPYSETDNIWMWSRGKVNHHRNEAEREEYQGEQNFIFFFFFFSLNKFNDNTHSRTKL